jgi:hypothetical protein
MFSTARYLFAGAALTLLAPVATAQSTFVMTLSGGVYEVDFNTLSPTLLFNAGVTGFLGATDAPIDTDIYATVPATGLYRIDTVAMTTTLIGLPGVGIREIAYNEDNGLLYGTDYISLYVLNQTTGQETLVGPLGTPSAIWSMDYDRSLGKLVLVDNTTSSMYSVDVTTAAATLIGPTGTTRVTDQWFDEVSGNTYGVTDGGGGGRLLMLDTATGAATDLATTGLNLIGLGGRPGGGPAPIGTRYCSPGVPNSTGASTTITATGSVVAANNDVTLTCSDMPNNAFAFFLTSATQGLIMNPGGSQGNLCLSGSIGRYVGPGQIQNSGASGSIQYALNLTQHPTPAGFVQVTAGQTWNFTCWHRDVVGGVPTSNFADAVSITFQ